MPSLFVIDDDPAVVRTFRLGLQETHTTVLSTQTGVGGLELVAKYRPDVVAVDPFAARSGWLRIGRGSRAGIPAYP